MAEKENVEEIKEPIEPKEAPCFTVRAEIEDPDGNVIGGKYEIHPDDLLNSRDPEGMLLAIFTALADKIVERVLATNVPPVDVSSITAIANQNKQGELN